MDYLSFLDRKTHDISGVGIEAAFIPSQLFGFQRQLVEWACRLGRAAVFANCGLGKTAIQLAWAENVARHTGKPVLILTPLAVGHQTSKEAVKFGIEAARSESPGQIHRITVANYERLHHYSTSDFAGVVCDESSILKNFDGEIRTAVTEFLRKIPYRLLCTATAAPNDYVELGTSSEALGYLGYQDMLERFFVNSQRTSAGFHGRYANKGNQWRFKGHAERGFWRWMTSWARACRKPSDLGFDDDGFLLPELIERDHIIKAKRLREGMLFDLEASGLHEEREEVRRTVRERCEKAAELVSRSERSVIWCNLNEEGKLLRELVPDAIEVSGADSDDQKQDKLVAFTEGKVRVLVTKPKIGAWGLNWQHCSHIVYFPTHSYEQYYQAIRRCWRFGQKREVKVDCVASEGQSSIRKNLRRKADQASRMFTALVESMGESLHQKRSEFKIPTEVPSWLSTIRNSPINTPSITATA